MNNKDFIAAVKEEFPGYDKSLNSKCNNSKYYGIKRIPEVEKLYKTLMLAEPPKTVCHESKKKPAKVTARFTKAQYKLLQRAIKASGYASISVAVQIAVMQWVMRVLEEKKTAAEAKAPTAANTLKQENYNTVSGDVSNAIL